MSQAAVLGDPIVTIAAFDAFLERQSDPRLWELVAGRIVGMTNPTEQHEQIVSNIGFRVRLAFGDRPCRVYFGGICVQRSENTRSTYKPRPDLLVRCGPVSSNNYVTDPLVVVEVLSPSTLGLDRREKLSFYQTVPTLTHIVLVYQDQTRVEHFRRTGTAWALEVLTAPDDALVFETLGATVTLAEAYAGGTPGPG